MNNMATPNLIENEATIVIVGSFNPAIFHPEWLKRHGLIPAVEAEGVDVEIVHNELAKFSLRWLDIEITSNRFQAKTDDIAQFMPLRDLIMGMFQILEHTPISQIGINRKLVYQMKDEAEWHKVGDTLAPKRIWEKCLPERPGLIALAIQSARNNEPKGKTNIKLSGAAGNKIVFDINQHIEITDNQASSLIEILNKNWQRLQDESENIGKTIIQEILDE